MHVMNDPTGINAVGGISEDDLELYDQVYALLSKAVKGGKLILKKPTESTNEGIAKTTWKTFKTPSHPNDPMVKQYFKDECLEQLIALLRQLGPIDDPTSHKPFMDGRLASLSDRGVEKVSQVAS
ncbi:hypothetical protein QFC24_004504 [Naganishia onofrii]|uniref:Uncharacterized protein n=1 Tax=Naganishia onofrii TaxID=1851511 RepID=A0ACC2XGS3_9TREE|nr:hypothetical protein QFC24_004504 [Naganishia onofrii]